MISILTIIFYFTKYSSRIKVIVMGYFTNNQ